MDNNRCKCYKIRFVVGSRICYEHGQRHRSGNAAYHPGLSPTGYVSPGAALPASDGGCRCAGMATGTVTHRPVTTIGSVQVTQGNFIEVRSEGVWYKDTISKMCPDEIEVCYVGSLGKDGEWTNLSSLRLHCPQRTPVGSPRQSDRVCVTPGTYDKYEKLADTDSS